MNQQGMSENKNRSTPIRFSIKWTQQKQKYHARVPCCDIFKKPLKSRAQSHNDDNILIRLRAKKKKF